MYGVVQFILKIYIMNVQKEILKIVEDASESLGTWYKNGKFKK